MHSLQSGCAPVMSKRTDLPLKEWEGETVVFFLLDSLKPSGSLPCTAGVTLPA